MRSVIVVVTLSLLASFILLTSCGGPSAGSNASANSANRSNDNTLVARTNVEELGMLINVPYQSEETLWKEDAARRKLTAVLRFTDAENSRVVSDAEKYGPAQPVEVTSESWFPPELVAQSDLNGEDKLSGHAFPANAFFQDPYNQGRLIKINDTDYFILELSSR
jgi:hypothetical protein